ncbi:unnamed protein product [Lasius platythorax]|uniref:Reverse transcriptase domain-containing protein n=1 Tax=Lasius platythorax TaxID=488582 RepID=A0AAV2NLN8_9HYME
MYANNGGWAVAVSLDIRNAFNSLPWPRIRETLINWNVPSYLLRIIDDYLDEWWIKYPCEDGTWRSTRVTRGVPQGSVLGPLLWNLTYNQVLETNTPDDVHVFCYADDTLIIGGADTKPFGYGLCQTWNRCNNSQHRIDRTLRSGRENRDDRVPQTPPKKSERSSG